MEMEPINRLISMIDPKFVRRGLILVFVILFLDVIGIAIIMPVLPAYLEQLTGGSVSEAAVESELTTFLNQVEGHTGKPAVLKLAPAFEERYHVAARIERNLWLERDWLEPDYAGRPWTLWTANSELRTAASDEPVRWVVLRP